LSGFSVTPEELHSAASTLGAVDATFACPTVGAGDLGSPELEAAVERFNAQAARLSQAMSQAVQAARANVAAAGYTYWVTDAAAMPGRP
jgi:hypothetical protein